MTKIRVLAFSLATVCLGFVSGARAQQPPAPCAADAEKLCKGVPVGQGAQIACLKEHKSELSPACKSKIMKAAEQKEPKQEPQQQAPSPAP